MDRSDSGLVPMLLVAATAKEYGLPILSPPILSVVAEAATDT